MLDPRAPRPVVPPGEIDTALDRPRAGAAVLSVGGELDTLTAPPLDEAVEELFACGDDVLVVDLTAVTFLASSGLAVLIRAAHRAAAQEVRLRLVAPSPTVLRPIEVTGAAPLFDIFDTRAAALAVTD